MRRPLVLAAAIVLSGVVVAGCGSDDDEGDAADSTTAAGKPVAIKAANFSFDPAEIQLAAGEAVTFMVENGDQVEHNLTVDGTDVDKDVGPGETAEAPATLEAGTYKFHCEYHPAQMQGTITVT